MIKLPPVPRPPPPRIRRFDQDGKPTPELVKYETQVEVFLQAVKVAIEGLP